MNYYQSKKHKRSKIKKLLYEVSENVELKPQEKPWNRVCTFSTVRGRWVLIIVTIPIAHFVLFLFCNEPAKKNYGVPYEPIRF